MNIAFQEAVAECVGQKHPDKLEWLTRRALGDSEWKEEERIAYMNHLHLIAPGVAMKTASLYWDEPSWEFPWWRRQPGSAGSLVREGPVDSETVHADSGETAGPAKALPAAEPEHSIYDIF